MDELVWHQARLMASSLRREIRNGEKHIRTAYDPGAAILLRSRRIGELVESTRKAIARIPRDDIGGA